MGDIPATGGDKEDGEDLMKADGGGRSKDKGAINQQWIRLSGAVYGPVPLAPRKPGQICLKDDSSCS